MTDTPDAETKYQEVAFDDAHLLSLELADTLREHGGRHVTPTMAAALALTLLRFSCPRTMGIDDEIQGVDLLVHYALQLSGIHVPLKGAH